MSLPFLIAALLGVALVLFIVAAIASERQPLSPRERFLKNDPSDASQRPVASLPICHRFFGVESYGGAGRCEPSSMAAIRCSPGFVEVSSRATKRRSSAGNGSPRTWSYMRTRFRAISNGSLTSRWNGRFSIANMASERAWMTAVSAWLRRSTSAFVPRTATR